MKSYNALTFALLSCLLFAGTASATAESKAKDRNEPSSEGQFFTAPSRPQLEIEQAIENILAQEDMLGNLNADEYDNDLWGRIRAGFKLSDTSSAAVRTQVSKFVRFPDGVERTTMRSSKYLYHVMQEVERREMPSEIALLPFIESSFNPHAFSSAKAAGLWQFVPATGLQYDLKQNRFKDERRDVIASTDAALTYLSKLYDMFGDWHLALAAYNWGEGSVQRAIKRNRSVGLGTDFESLAPLMPEETRNYVPRLLAIKEIISNPGKYGVTLPVVRNEPYFVAIAKSEDIDVKIAAKLAEMPVEDFRELNPQFNKAVITGDRTTSILLPASKVEKFKANLSGWRSALTQWSAHTVTGAKEKIVAIAKRFGTTPEVIREANDIPSHMEIAAGSTILVPRFSATSGPAALISETASIVLRPPIFQVAKALGRYPGSSARALRKTGPSDSRRLR